MSSAVLIVIFTLLFCNVFTVISLVTRPIIELKIDDSDSNNTHAAATKIVEYIRFPMLEIKNPGIKIFSHSNKGYIGKSNSNSYKEDLSGSARFKPKIQDSITAENVNVSGSETTQTHIVEDYLTNDIDAELQTASPPPYNETARMARYIVANCNWTSMSTISTREPTVGFPFSNIVSVSDGEIGKSTGIPYFYITPMDVSVIDLAVSNKASLSMTLAQGEYCKSKDYDPEDPRCARVILTGSFTKVKPGSAEEKAAKKGLFARHPVMVEWPKDHGFFCAKFDMKNILVLDYFGGAKTVTIEDYFKSSPY